MGRTFNNNTANYMSRASANFGLNGLTECSIAAWVNIAAATVDNQRVADKQFSTGTSGCPFRMQYTHATGEVSISVNNGAGQSPDWSCSWTPGFGVWTRVLFAYKRNAISVADGAVYLNGASCPISTFSANGYAAGFTIAEDSNNYFLGLRVITNLLPLNGSLGWLCVWNRQLTAQEAALDFQHPLNVTSGLVHRVQLNPDTDSSGNGNDMSVIGTIGTLRGPREEVIAWSVA